MKVKGGLYPIHENISLRRVLSSVTNYSKVKINKHYQYLTKIVLLILASMIA